MWASIIAGLGTVGSAMNSQWLSNKANKISYRSAAKTAEFKSKMAEANFTRRSAYRNEELGQAVWNIAQQGQELMGAQRASMAASGFDTSTGDQRILADTYRRNLEKISGINRTAYLQQFEDEIQTNSDILQYNYEAYANRQMAKQYSGWKGAAKVYMSGLNAAIDTAYQFVGINKGNKSGISSNTGATGTGWMSQGTQMAQSAGQSGFGSNKLSLGSYANFNNALKF